MKRFVQAFLFAGVVLVASSLSVSQTYAATAYGETILSQGSQGPQVVTLQADLRMLGYFTYPTNTGYYGEITETAVKAFQKDYMLQTNGKVGLTTGPLIQEEATQKRATEKADLKEVGAKVVATAKEYVGVQYQWGGRTPFGFDCSGYVGYVMQQFDVELPRRSVDMYGTGQAVTEPKPGDLVFFSTYAPGASHAGIYIGDGHFISATSSSGVKIDSMTSSYWGPRYVGTRSVF